MFNISPTSEHPGLISFRMDWLDLLVAQGTLESLLQNHSSKVVRKWAVGPNYFCEDARERGRKITTKYYPPFKNNTEHKVHIEGIFLDMMKAIYDSPTANILLSHEELKAFPPSSGTRQGRPFLSLSLNIVLKSLARAILKTIALQLKINKLLKRKINEIKSLPSHVFKRTNHIPGGV